MVPGKGARKRRRERVTGKSARKSTRKRCSKPNQDFLAEIKEQTWGAGWPPSQLLSLDFTLVLTILEQLFSSGSWWGACPPGVRSLQGLKVVLQPASPPPHPPSSCSHNTRLPPNPLSLGAMGGFRWNPFHYERLNINLTLNPIFTSPCVTSILTCESSGFNPCPQRCYE